VCFLALTGVALAADGVAGFPRAITSSRAAGQIYVDLVIAVVVICVWLHRDARLRGRNPWPWIVGAAVVGRISPLLSPSCGHGRRRGVLRAEHHARACPGR
jgi:hypothetical protein